MLVARGGDVEFEDGLGGGADVTPVRSHLRVLYAACHLINHKDGLLPHHDVPRLGHNLLQEGLAVNRIGHWLLEVKTFLHCNHKTKNYDCIFVITKQILCFDAFTFLNVCDV